MALECKWTLRVWRREVKYRTDGLPPKRAFLSVLKRIVRIRDVHHFLTQIFSLCLDLRTVHLPSVAALHALLWSTRIRLISLNLILNQPHVMRDRASYRLCHLVIWRLMIPVLYCYTVSSTRSKMI